MERNLKRQLDELSENVALCVLNWKIGYDATGYKHFICTLEKLTEVLEIYFEALKPETASLLFMIEVLSEHVRNKDINAIGDVLEFELQPFISEWRKVCDCT